MPMAFVSYCHLVAAADRGRPGSQPTLASRHVFCDRGCMTYRLRRGLFAALPLSFLLAAACSSDDDERPRTREEFCREWAAAACSSEVVSVCQAASPEACRLSQQGSCEALVPAAFSDARGDACLDAVRAAYADADLTSRELLTVFKLAAPCDRLALGSRERGQSCEASSDCDTAAGFSCVIKGGALEGTCEQPVVKGPGLSCAAAQEICTEGFYCNGENCVEGKPEGGSCTRHEECGPDGYCGADSECVARLTVNTPCSSDFECASGVCFALSGGTEVCLDRLRLSPSEPACGDLR